MSSATRGSVLRALLLSMWLPVLVSMPVPVSAQSQAPTPIKLEGFDKFKDGRLAVYTGTVAATPHVYTLDDIGILSPVLLTLRGEPDSGLRIKISKYAEEPLREVSLGSDGRANVSFRTQGGFYARVSAGDRPTPYALVVAVGDEVKPELPSFLATYEELENGPGSLSGKGASEGNPVLWVIAAALLAIVGLLALLVLKRNRP